MPDPHIASTPVASIAQQSPTNASKATSAPNAPNAPNATTKLFIANSSAHVNTSSSPLSIAKAAMLNATAAEEKLSLRRLRRLAVKVLAVLDGRRAEHIEPIEYVGTIAVVALGFGGAVWCVCSHLLSSLDHFLISPRALPACLLAAGRFMPSRRRRAPAATTRAASHVSDPPRDALTRSSTGRSAPEHAPAPSSGGHCTNAQSACPTTHVRARTVL